MELNIKENYIIYCKVICTHCGSDHELMHVRTPFYTDSVICKTCLENEIPTGDDIQKLIDKEVKETFTIEELKAFSVFESFWDVIDAQNGYEDDWEKLKLQYKGFYLNSFREFRGE